MKVLIVNSSGCERRFLMRLLSTLKFDQSSYIQAAHGYEALDLIDRYSFDLILTELSLPYLSGVELIDQLRLRQKTQQIPIIVITHLYTFAINDDFLKKQVHAIFSKPFKPFELEESINLIMNNHTHFSEKRIALH